MPIHLSQLMGSLTLDQAREMVEQAETAGGRGGETLFDILDPVREDEVEQRRQIKEAAAVTERDAAVTARIAKADAQVR